LIADTATSVPANELIERSAYGGLSNVQATAVITHGAIIAAGPDNAGNSPIRETR
jgi:hypothetical protein